MGLDIVYPFSKFEHSSFSHSRDMVGAHERLNSSRDLTTPLLGMVFVIRGLVFATINLSTKFEVSNYIYYKDTKGDTKYGKWGGLG